MGLPDWLDAYEVLGTTDAHVCLHVEEDIYLYWLSGRFERRHLDELARLVSQALGWRQPYATIVLTTEIDGYDPDLRTVMTKPGNLLRYASYQTIVVSQKPFERMVVQTMALAGRAAGNPGGRLGAAATFDEAVEDARHVLARANSAKRA